MATAAASTKTDDTKMVSQLLSACDEASSYSAQYLKQRAVQRLGHDAPDPPEDTGPAVGMQVRSHDLMRG